MSLTCKLHSNDQTSYNMSGLNTCFQLKLVHHIVEHFIWLSIWFFAGNNVHGTITRIQTPFLWFCASSKSPSMDSNKSHGVGLISSLKSHYSWVYQVTNGLHTHYFLLGKKFHLWTYICRRIYVEWNTSKTHFILIKLLQNEIALKDIGVVALFCWNSIYTRLQ